MVLFLQGHFFVRTSNLKANIHFVPFQFVKNSYFKFLQGSVATLFRWSWKVLSYFVANLSKTLLINFYQNRSSIVEVMIKNFWCLFILHSVVLAIKRSSSNSKGFAPNEGIKLEWGRKNLQFSANKSSYLRNDARYDQSYYQWLIVSRIRHFHWCQNQRPWMTLNSSTLLQKKCAFRSPPQKFEWRQTHTISGKNVAQWLDFLVI